MTTFRSRARFAFRPMLAASIVAALASLETGIAGASTTTTTLGVTATVTNNCTIASTPVAFGSYDPVTANASTALTATGTLSVACTKGDTLLSIALSNGANASSNQPQMKDSAGDMLPYTLYQPPNNTPGTACSYTSPTAWNGTGSSAFALTAPTTTAARTYNVCGSIAAAQNVPASTSYADSVTATLTF